mgnify:CR=1 FL=1
MKIDKTENINFTGRIIKTSAQTLPQKIQQELPSLKMAIGEKPYDVSLAYNKDEKILDFIYTQSDAKVKKHKHSVMYFDT